MIYVFTNTIPHYDLSFYRAVREATDGDFMVYYHRQELLSAEVRDGVSWAKSVSSMLELVRILFSIPRCSKVVIIANPKSLFTWISMVVSCLKSLKIHTWGMYHSIKKPSLIGQIGYRLLSLVSTRCLTYGVKGALNLSSLGVPSEKIFVVGVGIDAVGLRLQPKSLERDVLIVGAVIRFSGYKNLELLLDALEYLMLRDEIHKFRAILVGGGERYASIMEKIARLGLQDYLTVQDAVYDSSTLEDIWRSIDVTCVPSSIGLTAISSLCRGIPVITERNIFGQSSEYFELYEGFNSFEFEKGDVQSLAQCLLNVYENRLTWLGWRKTIHEAAVAKFSISRKVNNFIRALDN